MKKKTLALLLIVFCFSGCALQRVSEREFIEGKIINSTAYFGLALFNKSAVEGMRVGDRQDNTSTTFSLSKGNTETQAEAIKAAGEALGAGIAAGVKKAVVP